MKLNAAIIGIGNMGKNHARVYSELPESDLIAIADIDEKIGKSISNKYGCKYYKNYRDMLNEDIDVISICVPTALHYKIARDVINAGINILIEKPITNNLKQAEGLVRLAKKKGIKLTVGHIERFNPAVKKLKEIIDKGKLGKITSLLARRVGPFPPNIKGSNVIIDLAVHDIDVFNYILGKMPTSVYAKCGRGVIKKEDYAGLFLTYNSTNAIIEVNWITPAKIRILNVTGTKGYVDLDYINQELVLYKNNYKKSYDGFGDFVYKFGKSRKINIKVDKDEPLKVEVKHFLWCIKNDKEPLVSGMDGINVLRIALSYKNYIKGGQTVI